ncbi:uncharacterized protein PG998_010727 [Apiospora kogelbergensis]|uniref:uncharacterized protein n=1 Tax=Apiospora kogelbergensis TaxID=1337665 RepID=UPI003132140E
MDPFPGKGPLIEAGSPRHTAVLQDGRGSDLTNSGTNSNNILDRIAMLERENQELKRTQPSTFRCEKFYFIPSDGMPRPGGPKGPGVMLCYLDEPTWASGNMGGPMLRCNLPVNDINGFLRQRSDITFVVAYHYTPAVQEAEVAKAILTKKDLPRPIPTSEFITLHDKTLIAAMEEFLSMQPNFQDDFPNLKIRGQIPAPYLFWYQYRSSNALQRLNQTSREVMNFFTSWIDEHYSQKFALAEDHLSRRVVSEETMPFLVKPGDVLVWEQRRKIHAVVAKDWLRRTSSPRIHQVNKEREMNWSKTETSSNIVSTRWSTDGWHFEFDGEFHRKTMSIDVNLRFDESEEEINIDKLTKYPLRFASSRIEASLERRGTIFWKCRNQHLVSYEDEHTGHTNGERFMIDYKTYQQLHTSPATVTTRVPKANNDTEDSERISLDVMEDDDPPPSPDIYVFPDKIPGYNLHTKKWVDLSVDHIQDVEWNKESFKHLVVEPNTKELIQALVRHQIASEQGTDIVNRKGNGLIILLHGGPGTGKTFTAESVAEMAEKPLFRVTCGDIGTKPEDVEKYLESALYLGKIWSCIVLIDEAEVFLEQRSLDNLERNALVSVFLRVLEYYEGILILTSNRRTQIWKNMFKRLEKISKNGTGEDVASKTEPGSRKRKAMDDSITGIDFDEVNCYITELAKQDLNGRQIRNIITTARQLATFRNTQMRYEHLQHVIAVSGKFDTYLKKLQEGFSDDQIARDEGFR